MKFALTTSIITIVSIFFATLVGGNFSKKQKETTLKEQTPRITKSPHTNQENFKNQENQTLRIAWRTINIQREPSRNSEVVTQGIYGESVKILQKSNDWVEVSLPDQSNYTGWLPNKALTLTSIYDTFYSQKIVSSTNANVLNKPDINSNKIVSLPMGSVISSDPTYTNENFIKINLLDGQIG
jgi:hypothetical protein